MFGKKPIKVCNPCSGFDVTELDGVVGKGHYAVGCIRVCKQDRDESKFYAMITGAIVECETKEELLALAKTAAEQTSA